MENQKHFSRKSIHHITNRLWELESILKGLAALFQQHGGDGSFGADELFGIGQILKGLSLELSALEDILNSTNKGLSKD